MQAGDIKLGKVFANDHVNVIPLFQRPYVWGAEDNWAPLWEEMKHAAKEVEIDRASDFQVTHKPLYFLGAVVTQQRNKDPRRLDSSYVIDGQQRLTTMQVVLAAIRAVAFGEGKAKLGMKCGALIENREETLHEDFPEDRYKLWPLPQDREAFLWAVRSPDEEENSCKDPNHRLVKARIWFEEKVSEWVNEDGASEDRLDDLVFAIQDRMQLVQIILDSNDQPQVIFEALNHRGVRLAASDLVKNKLFYALEKQGDGALSEKLLIGYWIELDGSYWRENFTSGHTSRARVDHLLAYWLTVKVLDEVQVESLFTTFSRWMERDGCPRAQNIIKDLRLYADTYRQLLSLKPVTATGRLIQSLSATKITVVWPTLLFLQTNKLIPREQREKAAAAIDSYITRRAIAKLTPKDYNKLFILVVKEAAKAPPEKAGDAIVDCLASQTAESRYWPNDKEFEAGLLDPFIYRRIPSVRLKSVLVSMENHLRTDTTAGDRYLQAELGSLNIEHVMPQKWEESWELENPTEEKIQKREDAVGSLGNLTIATTKLNPMLSNKAWEEKSLLLKKHSLLHITADSILSAPPGIVLKDGVRWDTQWDEQRIKLRGQWMVELAKEIWQRPSHAQDCAYDTKKKKIYSTTLKEIITSGLLSANTEIHSTSSKWPAVAKITQAGNIIFDGKKYSSLSSVGAAARTGVPDSNPNGWEFWAVKQSDGTLKTLANYRAEYDANNFTDKTKRIMSVRMEDLMEAGIFTTSSKLLPADESISAIGILMSDGKILVDGEIYSSISMAATMLNGGRSTDGWKFWCVQKQDGTNRSLAAYKTDYLKSLDKNL